MSGTISWVHIGNMDEATGWENRGRLAAIVGEIKTRIGDAADFVYLPGDLANHATAEQYPVIVETLAPLRLPYRVIPGDHDFELGDLAHYEAAFPAANGLNAGLHEVTASCGPDRDSIRILVCAADDIPRRGVPVAPERAIHAIGAWPEHGIEGMQLGPNKNGKHR